MSHGHAPPPVGGPTTPAAPTKPDVFKTCDVIEGEEIEPFLARERKPHLIVLGLLYGVGFVLAAFGFLWAPLAIAGIVVAVTGLIYVAALAFWFGAFVRSVGGRSYAVQSSGGKIRTAVHGPGMHKIGIGNRMAQIETNPLPVDIEVKRQLKTYEVVTIKFQVTVSPNPKIADSDGLNVYGNWVVEGVRKKQRGFAAHHVQAGIIAPIKALLNNMLAEMSREELDQNQYALALLVESELALHVPAHKDEEFRRSVEGVALRGLGFNEILAWYGKHHEKVREHLDHMNHEFETGGVAEQALSHHERHIGCTFESCQLVSADYDAKSVEFAQKQLAAQADRDAALARAPGIKQMTEDAIRLGVSPNFAFAGANAQAGIKPGDVKVIVADDKAAKTAASIGAGFNAGSGGST